MNDLEIDKIAGMGLIKNRTIFFSVNKVENEWMSLMIKGGHRRRGHL